MILILKSIKTSESVSCTLVRVLLCISKYFDFIVSPLLCMFKKRLIFFWKRMMIQLRIHACSTAQDVSLSHQLCQFATIIHTCMG